MLSDSLRLALAVYTVLIYSIGFASGWYRRMRQWERENKRLAANLRKRAAILARDKAAGDVPWPGEKPRD